MLTAAAQHQDADAFDALYRDNATDLFAYILTLVRDRACAEDLTHTSFERAYRRYDRFDARRGSARRCWPHRPAARLTGADAAGL